MYHPIPNLTGLPDDLVNYPWWCIWRYGAVRTNDKRAKNPLCPRTGRVSDAAKYPARIAVDALLAVQIAAEQGIGVGIMLGAPGWDLLGVDVDNNDFAGECDARGVPLVLLPLLAGTQVEISPSGKGWRAFYYGASRYNSKILRNNYKFTEGPLAGLGVEVYPSGKFLTVTGNAVQRVSELPTISDEQLAWLAEYMTRPVTPVVERATPTSVQQMSADTRMRAMFNSKRGAHYNQLWNGELAGTPGQNERDLALYRALVFWLANDEAAIDAAFRQSGCMRDKWERADYRAMTRNAALSNWDGKFYGGSFCKTAAARSNDNDRTPPPTGPRKRPPVNTREDARATYTERRTEYVAKLATAPGNTRTRARLVRLGEHVMACIEAGHIYAEGGELLVHLGKTVEALGGRQADIKRLLLWLAENGLAVALRGPSRLALPIDPSDVAWTGTLSALPIRPLGECRAASKKASKKKTKPAAPRLTTLLGTARAVDAGARTADDVADALNCGVSTARRQLAALRSLDLLDASGALTVPLADLYEQADEQGRHGRLRSTTAARARLAAHRGQKFGQHSVKTAAPATEVAA